MWLRLAAAFLLWMVFAFSFLESIMVAIRWWKGEPLTGLWDWLWLASLPVWTFVYLRYYSIFRPGCRACVPPEDRLTAKHDNPGGTG